MSRNITIRILDSPDAEHLVRLRLGGLQESPAAFASSYSEEAKTPVAEIGAHLKPDLERSWVLGAFCDGLELVGMAGFSRERGPKHLHKAILWGFYVRPELRGRHIGRQLLEEFVAKARLIAGLRQVKLTVNPTQTAAIHLYRSLGFERFGCEPDAMEVDGRFYDEDYMVLRLDPAPPLTPRSE